MNYFKSQTFVTFAKKFPLWENILKIVFFDKVAFCMGMVVFFDNRGFYIGILNIHNGNRALEAVQYKYAVSTV